MLDSEPSNRETDTNEPSGRAAVPAAATAPAPTTAPAAPAIPAAVFQPPQVLFQPPAPVATPAPAPVPAVGGDRTEPDAEDGSRTSRSSRTRARTSRPADDTDGESGADADGGRPARRTRGGRGRGRARDIAPDDDLFSVESAAANDSSAVTESADVEVAPYSGAADDADEGTGSRRSRRRRNSRTSRTGRTGEAAAADDDSDDFRGADSRGTDSRGAGGAAGDADGDSGAADDGDGADSDDGAYGEGGASGRRRRRKRRRGSADTDVTSPDDPPDTVVHVREPHNPQDDVRAIKGSTRLEAKKQRRREGRESGRRRPPVITESEFLARRESVERTMVVRQRGDRTQIAVLEDGVLVEHYVNKTTHQSYVGNVYLGKVQNVLPSMEAAFVDIGKGRNAVLYAGEVNFDASGLEGQPKRIESALKAGQAVIVQVTKDPVGHKGARLTSQVSLPGRYLVYVPGASMTGISRKLPETERARLKTILRKVTPEHAGVIVRTAAEGAAEAELDRDITRLAAQWETIEKKAKTASAPALLYGEPDLTVRVIRDVFNEDFSRLIVSGDDGWEIIDEYVRFVAPHLAERISRWDADDDPADDVFAAYRIDEQLAKALERKVWLPSGGSLVIDRTEAMTVIDVNTGKFTGQGGNLEETVTRNNLEAAEEIVRQLRVRDVGGIVVIDFIDMVLESNRELVLRRLLECLARDRTKHQVAEVTSLGLVQMTRKRVGAGLLEAFSQQCECCNGRGVILTLETPPEPAHRSSAGAARRPVPAPPPLPPNGNGNASAVGSGNGRGRGNRSAGVTYANGRPAHDDEFTADTRSDTALVDTALADTALADTALADTALADAGLADAGLANNVATGSALDGADRGGTAASAAAGDRIPTDSVTDDAAREDTADANRARNGGRRTRRPTNGGTAFAAVVEDTAPVQSTVVPVVTDAPASPPAQPATSGFAPVVTGTTTDATDDAAPAIRRTRTRAGSAVARVTVVSDPEPPLTTTTALPDAPPAPEALTASDTFAAPDALAGPEAQPLTDDSAPAGATEPESAAAVPALEATWPEAAAAIPATEAAALKAAAAPAEAPSAESATSDTVLTAPAPDAEGEAQAQPSI